MGILKGRKGKGEEGKRKAGEGGKNKDKSKDETPQAVHAYEIFPTNFAMLPEVRQDDLTARFHAFLNALPAAARVMMVKGKRGIDLGNRSVVVEYPTFYIECAEPLDDVLEASKFVYQKVDRAPVPEVLKARRIHLTLEDGTLAHCLTAYELPAALPIGFLSELYGVADLVQFTAAPLEPEVGAAKIESYKKTLNALVSANLSKRRTPNQALLVKREMAEKALAAVTMGSSRLFKTSLTFAVFGKSQDELREKAKKLRNRLNARLVRTDAPLLFQQDLYEGKGKVLFVDTVTLGTYYPFVAGEVLESGGLFLGVNTISGAPVIYNPLVRPNMNISIIGTSGSGKSFTSKIFLKRLLDKDPDIPVFVIDPEGEYTALMETLGGTAIRVKRLADKGEGLGLDPLALFDKGEAADAICDIARLTDGREISRVRDLVMTSDSLADLYTRLGGDLRDSGADADGGADGAQATAAKKKARKPTPEGSKDRDLAEKMSSMLNGPESFIFRGTPLPFTPKMSFDLKGIDSKLVKQLTSLLIFGKIWQIISKPDAFGLTITTPRLVLVDEAWLFMEIPSAAAFLEKAARLGRKRNCILMINTQRPADMIGDPRYGTSASKTATAGRTILENSATKVLMRQDDSNRRLVGEAFGLSEQESDATVDFQTGEGLLITETTHAKVKFLASSEEEYALFTTKPSDMV